MKVLKNPEVRRTAAVLLVIEALFGVVCLSLDLRAGAAASVAFLLIFFWYLWDAALRYRKMADLAAGLDELLHGSEVFSFTEYREGELSLLQNEIMKLTIRMREQSGLLPPEQIGLLPHADGQFHDLILEQT